MIANISKSGSNFHGVIKYNDDKTKEINQANGQLKARLIDRHLIRNREPNSAAQKFDNLSKYSISTRKVMHISLSFHPDDAKKLDTRRIINISRDYLKDMGYEKQPRLIYQHFDTGHPHIHIITSRVNVDTNTLINDSHERRKSKAISEKLEQKYGLTIADKHKPNWKTISVEERLTLQEQKKIDLEKTPLVKKIKRALKNEPRNITELNKQLKENGTDIRVREIGKGIVYNRVNENDIVISKLRKGSDFKTVGIDKEGLIEAFKKS